MMSKRNKFFVVLVAAALVVAAGIPFISGDSNQEIGLIAGQNVNMVANEDPLEGDPYLQRQNEPSIAASSRNPLHLLAGANDYRTIDMPFDWEIPGFIFEAPTSTPPDPNKDAWVGVFKSIDGGLTWTSTLLPGFPQDNSPEGMASPLKQMGYTAAADPVVRTGTNGLFFYSGIAFTRPAVAESANGAEQPSSVFVARFIDNNNQEDTETIEYIDTQIIDHSENYIDPTIFLDKPWLATDLPQGVGQQVTINGQQIPRSNVYVVYSVFSGTGDAMESKIMFQRSTDCGETWDPPVELSTGHYLNQGATIAVDPRGNGQLCVSWRRFETVTQTNAIVVAISTNSGVDFDRDIVVSEFSEAPFDQPTMPTGAPWPSMFRTNAYPTSTMDAEGNIYVAWTKRNMGPNLEAHIMISTSHDGLNWSLPKKAITSLDDWTNPYFAYAPGYEFMPSITFAAGKLIMIWYDQRWDVSAWLHDLVIFGDDYIWEDYPIRHTIDVRAAQAEPSLDPVFSKSIQVSRYRWIDINGYPFQIEFNMPNLPLFQIGTAPFIGDYIDIAPSPSIVPEGNHWRFNKDPNPSTIYHATWTDNRDVKLAPGDQGGDWGETYNPPGGGCDPDYAGIRNQNIYTARISEGIIAGSPGNTKPLNILRAFVILVKNTTAFEKIVTLEKDPYSLPTANFWQAGQEVPSLTVTIPPYSSLSATVLVEPYPDENASVVINVLDENNNIISQVTLNPDQTNPQILDPGNWDPQDPALSILSSEIHTPHSRNYDPENPPILTPHSRNYDLENQLLMNTDLLTPHSRNYDLENAPVLNPHSRNSALEALEGPDEGVEVTDLIWTVENSGNTTSSYSLSTFPVNVPEGVEFQILVYKIYLTPMTMNCDLLEEENHELVVSITNPHSRNNPLAIDGSFHLAPGEQANIIYRVYTPEGSDFDPQSLIPAMIQDVPNVIDGVLQSAAASAVVITTATTPDGVIGQPYSKILQATGGIEPYLWSVTSGELPPGLTLDPSTGEIFGSPANDPNVPEYSYIYEFTVHVSDASDPAQTATQALSIRISEELVINSVSLPDWIVNAEYPEKTLQATGGIGPYTWTILSGQLPPGVNLTQVGDQAVISGTPTSAGSYAFTVEVLDSSNPQQSATLTLAAVIYEQLMITTESLDPSEGHLGSSYSATIQAIGGLSPYTWEATGQLPPGLNLTQVGNDALISGTPIYDPDAIYPQEYTFDVTVTEFSPLPLEDTLNCSLTIYPKTHQLDAKYEGLGDNKATAMAVDDEGNIYVTGYSRGNTTGPDIYTVKYNSNLIKIWSARYDGPSHLGDFGTDIVVKKYQEQTYVYVTGYIHRGKQVKHADYCTLMYDSDGNLIWDTTYDSRRNGQDYARAIAVDDEGNIYVTGESQESLEDEPLRSFDYLTIKYNSRGRMQWEARYEGLVGPTDDLATAIVVNPGHVYVTGTSSNGTNTDIATIKYDATNGSQVWLNRYNGGHDDGANALAVDNGYVYVTGSSSDGTNKDFATIKYDATNGNPVWLSGVITDGGGYDDVANDMVVEAGKVYVTGFSSNGADNDFATFIYNATDGSQIGNAISDGGYGNDEAVAISVDSFGDIYVTGTSDGASGKDYFTLKYNTSGSVIWLARYDSASSWNDFATVMIVYSGNVYVAGYSQNPANVQNNHILIVKYSN